MKNVIATYRISGGDFLVCPFNSSKCNTTSMADSHDCYVLFSAGVQIAAFYDGIPSYATVESRVI